MDFERLNGDIKEMRRRNRGLSLTVGVLAAGQILALIVILNLLGTVRTIVVPPSIDKTFWVTRDKASSEYLEQMGSFIAWLVLEVKSEICCKSAPSRLMTIGFQPERATTLFPSRAAAQAAAHS